MGIGILPMMGIGAGLGLLRGGGVKGALTGAALGGAGGAVGNMLKAGEALKGAELISSAKGGLGASVVPGSIESAGMVTGASGNLVNPEYFAGAGSPLQTYTGGQGLFSNMMGNISSTLPDYVTPQNVLGAANILSQSQPRQQQLPTAPGGMKQGSTQGLAVNYGMAQPIQRKRGLV